MQGYYERWSTHLNIRSVFSIYGICYVLKMQKRLPSINANSLRLAVAKFLQTVISAVLCCRAGSVQPRDTGDLVVDGENLWFRGVEPDHQEEITLWD